MISGIFLEQSTDTHVMLRKNLLESKEPLPSPSVPPISLSVANFSEEHKAQIIQELHSFGLAVIQLDSPLSNHHFAELGSWLGTAMPETDPAVLPFVEQEVILNLVSQFGHTTQAALQPFATNFLSLHTESSSRSVEGQPRYIILMCCEPGSSATVAQTVLVPTRAVEHLLKPEEIAVLAHTRYRNNHHGPSIIRRQGERNVFSFRDFLNQPLEWVCTDSTISVDAVNNVILGLLTAMYAPNVAVGIHWHCGMIVIIDNTYYFHGRTAGAFTAVGKPRHLKRLRILHSGGDS